jgi:hypothetical protein
MVRISVIGKPVYPLFFLGLIPFASTAQVILQPAADSIPGNVIVGSRVAPDGTNGHTTDACLVKSDRAQIGKLTGFGKTNAAGVVAVAVGDDRSRIRPRGVRLL